MAARAQLRRWNKISRSFRRAVRRGIAETGRVVLFHFLTIEDLATLRDIRNDLQLGGARIGMAFARRGLVVLDKLLEAVADSETEGQLCLSSHYAVVVEAHKDSEIYQRGDADCRSCLIRMAEKHQAVADVFRARLIAIGETP
jgi:hypothetical protein